MPRSATHTTQLAFLSATLASAALPSPASAGGIHNPAAHYFSFADSPFAATDFSSGFFYLENFEDGLLNTPGVSNIGGIALRRSDVFSDSVDGDDGTIDNNGNTGGATTGAFYSNGLVSVRFSFAAAALGNHLPTHVGLVVTDCVNNSAVTLTAYRGAVAIGSSSGSQISEKQHFTQQDRFYGFVDNAGIESIVLSFASDSDWAMDHLQYGYAPCPADLNGDMRVDDADFVIFVKAYNTLDCADPAMPAGCPADFNRDGAVDDADFTLFVGAYNSLLCP